MVRLWALYQAKQQPQTTEREIICTEKNCKQRGKPEITCLETQKEKKKIHRLSSAQAERKRSEQRGVTEQCNGGPLEVRKSTRLREQEAEGEERSKGVWKIGNRTSGEEENRGREGEEE